jgi:SAM-dependent methyltransferase
MDHDDHVALIRDAVDRDDRLWAEFGSGTGAFTLALVDTLPDSARIISVDKDRGALRLQQRSYAAHLRGRNGPVLEQIHADYTHKLKLPPLDGVLMANALHFQKHKEPILRLIQYYLRPEGRFLLVEYDTDRGNHWVPHPMSYPTWERLALEVGFKDVRKLATRPSRFLGGFYSAVAWR